MSIPSEATRFDLALEGVGVALLGSVDVAV